MSHVGRSGVVRCDHCGKVVQGLPDIVRIGDKERHFCSEASCMEEFFVERFRDSINGEVEKQVREEFNFLHKQVCPACRHRFITKTNMVLEGKKS